MFEFYNKIEFIALYKKKLEIDQIVITSGYKNKEMILQCLERGTSYINIDKQDRYTGKGDKRKLYHNTIPLPP